MSPLSPGVPQGHKSVRCCSSFGAASHPPARHGLGKGAQKVPNTPKSTAGWSTPPATSMRFVPSLCTHPPPSPQNKPPPTPSPNPQIPHRLRVTPPLGPSLAIPCSRGGMEAPGWGGGGSEAGALGAAAAVVAGAAAGGAARAAGGAASPAAAAAGAVGVIAAAAAAAVRVGAQRAGGRGAGAVVGDGTLASAAEGKGKLSHGPGVG